MNAAPDRMSVTLESFVAEWFADEPPGEPASWGPEPLQVFHQAAAGRDAVYDGSIVIDREPPSEPGRADGLVAFGRESEGVFEMLFDPADPALPVFYDFGVPGRPLMAERAGLGEFLLHRTLTAVTMGRLSAFAFATGDEVRRITASLTPVPVQPLSHPAPGMRTLIGPGLVVHTGRKKTATTPTGSSSASASRRCSTRCGRWAAPGSTSTTPQRIESPGVDGRPFSPAIAGDAGASWFDRRLGRIRCPRVAGRNVGRCCREVRVPDRNRQAWGRCPSWSVPVLPHCAGPVLAARSRTGTCVGVASGVAGPASQRRVGRWPGPGPKVHFPGEDSKVHTWLFVGGTPRGKELL